MLSLTWENLFTPRVMPQQRQLAAIMFADIVGYTAVMQEHELQALTLIKHFNSSLETIVPSHNGKVLNNYGDGSLCIFQSATEAINCSIELQKNFNADQQVPVRIGLHVGEIIFEAGKVFGDGVNLASRIQSLGQANTILFSKEIYDKIKNHPEFVSVSIGYFDFKNVNEPMEVFTLVHEGLASLNRHKIEGKINKSPKSKRAFLRSIMVLGIALVALLVSIFLYDRYFRLSKPLIKKSIAVLPFINMSNDAEQDYFAQGMMDEILNHLFKMGGVTVVSRTSSTVYKDSQKTSKEIASELGVANLLEGSVQKYGERIRVIVKLIDGETDTELWADSYDKEFRDVFAIQSDIAEKVATELSVNINPDMKRRIEHIPTKSTAAYNLVLQAAEDLYSTKGTMRTKMLIEQAIASDSNYADAYAWMAIYWLNQGGRDGDLNRE
ncbi:MAG TPA: adenylate/guanylate cyclase domain-containing protein, partial [Chryseolinea sp.]|nr:adenylate/guanylate cyclase domain-containing protein [Chryseolinea sp.]